MKKIISIIFTLFAGIFLSASLFAQNPIIQDLQSKPGLGNQIILSWKLPQNADEITSLRLYRSAKPITTYTQLEKMNYIAQLNPGTTKYTDSVFDFNDYFYAIIAVTDKPYDFVLVSMNSTVNGVHLNQPENDSNTSRREKEEKLYAYGTMRETPLPFLDYIEGLDDEEQISDMAITSAASLASGKNKSKLNLPPYFFEEDLISPDGGDDYLLFEILKNTFVQEKYKEAIFQFNKLTGTNISQNIINRAIFYTGEAYYFSGNYEDAVKNFVKIQQVYPLLADRWINASLDKMLIR